MSLEQRTAHRERARRLGRVMLTIGLVPAVFLVWNSIGLPAIPGVGFARGSGQADSGLVVRIAAGPDARGSAKPFRDRASAIAAAAHRGLGTAASAEVSASPRPLRPVNAGSASSDAPDTPHRASVRTPSRTPQTEPAIPPPSPMQQTTVPVTLPALPPPLPTVQVPAIPVPVTPPPLPPLPPLPPTPALPALPGVPPSTIP